MVSFVYLATSLFKGKKIAEARLYILRKIDHNIYAMTKHKYDNETDSDLMYDNETKVPPQYRVIILNDDYTPMDFVIHVLVNVFEHDEGSAHKIMLDIHKKGSGLGGIYTFEIAETKSMHMNQLAIENKYPLKSFVEEDV